MRGLSDAPNPNPNLNPNPNPDPNPNPNHYPNPNLNQVFPTPLREHFGRSPFALDHVLERSDAPRKEVRLVKWGFKEGGVG